MPTREISSGGGGRRYVEVDLQVLPLELNLTSLRSTLRDGQASMIVGRDVIHPGRLAKAPRRRPITPANGIALVDAGMAQDLDMAFGGHPLTTAISCSMRGNVIKRQSYNSGPLIVAGSQYKYVDVAKTTVKLTLTADGMAKYGNDWPEGAREALADGKPVNVVFDDHLATGRIDPKAVREFATENVSPSRPSVTIGSLDVPLLGVGGANLDEAFATPAAGGDTDNAGNFFDIDALAGFNFSIVWTEYFDKRGLWVSNGQKFWLLQNGRYTKFLDLTAASGTLGIAWRGTQISPNVFMFVHPQFPPRIIPLEAEPRPTPTSGPVLTEVDALSWRTTATRSRTARLPARGDDDTRTGSGRGSIAGE